MYCSKCGAENKDDSLFCTKCGEKILDVNVKDDKGAEIKGVEKDKTNLFSAHLLNIIAFVRGVMAARSWSARRRKSSSTLVAMCTGTPPVNEVIGS